MTGPNAKVNDVNEKLPGSASFAASERYTAPRAEADAEVTVLFEGEMCPAAVLGRNGPRVQLRVTRGGATYVRWFNSSELLAETG